MTYRYPPAPCPKCGHRRHSGAALNYDCKVIVGQSVEGTPVQCYCIPPNSRLFDPERAEEDEHELTWQRQRFAATWFDDDIRLEMDLNE